MFCPKCGAVIPNGVHNCVQCGTIVQNSGFGAQVGSGMNNMGNTAYQGVNQAGESVNRAAYAAQSCVSACKNASEIRKKGDDAFTMSIVALVLSILQIFSVVSLILGIIALKWAKIAYPITLEHNHELAKTLSIVAIVLSSIGLAVQVIGGIILIVGTLAGTAAAFSDFDMYDMMIHAFI